MRSRTVSLPPSCCRLMLSAPPIPLASSRRRSISSTSFSHDITILLTDRISESINHPNTECETRGGFHASLGRGNPCTLVLRKMRDFVPVRTCLYEILSVAKVTLPVTLNGRG